MDIDRRDSPVSWASWINVILGIWLIIAPFVLGFSHDTVPMWNSIILGILVIIVAWYAATHVSAAVSWWNVVFGIWLIISPFVLRFNTDARAEGNAILLGIVVGVLALIAALLKNPPHAHPMPS